MSLHTEGRNVKDDNENIVYLRGVNKAEFLDDSTGLWTALGNSLWDDFGNWNEANVRAHFEEMRRWDINVIRLMIRLDWWFNNFQGTATGQPANRQYIPCIVDTVRIAQEYGIYIALCPWTTGEAQTPNPIAEMTVQTFVNFWLDVANKVGIYPNVLYDLWNEPNDDTGIAITQWFNACVQVINALRNIGDQHLVVVQWGYNGPVDFIQTWINQGRIMNNILFDQHLYRHHGSFPDVNVSDLNAVRTWINNNLYWGTAVNMWNAPVWCGEIGAYNPNDDLEYICFVNALAVLNELKIGYAAWQWTRVDVPWRIQQNTTFMPQPNRVGQALIDAIGATASLIADADGPYVATIDNPTVNFVGSASGGTPPYFWLWEFGDGLTSTEQNPSHTYASTINSYTAQLTVIDSNGVQSQDVSTIQISEGPPVSMFDNCDSLTPPNGNWAAFPAATIISLDSTTPPFEGSASIRGDLSPLAYNGYLYKNSPAGDIFWDLRTEPILKPRIMISAEFPVEVTVVTAEGGWKEYHILLSSLTPNVWNTFSINLAEIIPAAGLALVRQLRFLATHNNRVASINVDAIETLSITQQKALVIQPFADGNVTVNGVPVPGSGKTLYFDLGAIVTLTALPFFNTQLSQWTFDGQTATETVLTLAMTQDWTVQATFTTPPPPVPAGPLHVEGKYLKDQNGQIVTLQGGWAPIFENTCNAQAALEGEMWNARASVTTWRADACNLLLDVARQWGLNTIASFIWCDWYIYNSRTELGVSRTSIVTDRPYRQNIREFCQLAQAKGIQVQLRPYGVEAGYGGVGEGRVNFPFPVPGESYTHNGSIFPDADALAQFWHDVALDLADIPNVIFNLYDEPIISYQNVNVWFDACAKAIAKIRQAEAEAATQGRTSYSHLIQIHWSFDGPCIPWIPDWLNYATANGVDLTNVFYSNHIYRDQGYGAEDAYGPPPYPFDYITQKAILQYAAGDPNIPDYPEGFSRKPYGRAWKHVVDTYNICIVATFGANRGWINNEELQAFKNTGAILNEWQIGYWVYVWWRTGMVWSIVESTPVVSPPNLVGLALINLVNVAPQQVMVSGKVTDNKAQPLQGVSVATNSFSTQTDVNGNYTLVVPQGMFIIIYTKTGYLSSTRQVDATAGDVTGVNVILTPQLPPTPQIPWLELAIGTVIFIVLTRK